MVHSAARTVVHVIQLCKNTLQMSTACPKFRVCAGSDGPRLLFEVSVGGVALEFIALNDVNLGPRACKLLRPFHKSTSFKTEDCQTRTPFHWILLDFLWSGDFDNVCYFLKWACKIMWSFYLLLVAFQIWKRTICILCRLYTGADGRPAAGRIF